MLPFAHEKGKLLASLTTLGIGGEALYFAKAQTIEEMEAMLGYCKKVGLNFFILGKGSNSLFDDRGFNGLVILNKIDHLIQEGSRFKVGAGFSFSYLGNLTSRRGFGGLEFAVGIPASVGGAIYMNAGANGHEVKDALESVLYLNEDGRILSLRKEELEFRYRFSSFQKMRGAILEGVFSLTPSDKAKEVQEEILNYRMDTQPYKAKSAGCVFRNPESLSAGRLIDECGLKGLKVGGAEVSMKHANFLVNSGKASASDFLALMQEIKERIFKEKGIHLEEEIRFIPYE